MLAKENIFTVSEINRHLKNVVESNIPQLFVEGEISNFKHHSSGHIYFSLKDETSSIRCVFFSTYNRYLKTKPKNGDKVICGGKITIYEIGGNYQLNVSKLIPVGVGKLQLEFEELKDKLSSEGLFDVQNKKNIPIYPNKIGIITAETGAAIQDIKNVLLRRFPCKIIVFSSLVQGKTAAKSLIAGLEYFNQNPVDTIILARGGGSQEDLFCFNDEELARKIFESKIPIITGIGHEIDFTIADFVADLRAPTPSAAAELAVPNRFDIIQYIDSLINRIDNIVLNNLQKEKLNIRKIENRLSLFHPEIKFLELKNLLDILTEHLINFHSIIHLKRENIQKIKQKMILNLLEISKKKISGEKNKVNNLFDKSYKKTIETIKKMTKYSDELNYKLLEFSPENALKRGYGIIRKDKNLIKSIEQIKINDKLEIILKDGNLNCRVMNKSTKTIL